MKKQRLDLLLLELGLFSSREAAQAAIMDGAVLVNKQKVTKSGTPVAEGSQVDLLAGWGQAKYVSRGGLKLEKALREFAVDVSGRICLDIGASTGGFTDCLLKSGAQRVYAVDVGYGQLDWSLRQDSRVVVKERINARHLTPEILYQPGQQWADLAVVDLAFISLVKVLPAILSLLDTHGYDLICLIKPQFEAGRESVGKGGVVRSPAVHIQVIESLLEKGAELGLVARAATFSPIKGPAGNIEYLVHWSDSGCSRVPNVPFLVDLAFAELTGIAKGLDSQNQTEFTVET